ncbi:hypothetical protein LSM04_000999 [Trypanosoma melophagium]|uniref:uncharacterized protein n=1 Tax=Trypanosoma melophagium TaxID=715481 RepID=UPI00351A090D|nr:hypothetical protein LSM04_000999 [Trypanosoma melophagium]
MRLQQTVDAASSPPLREKTCTPLGAERYAVNSNVAVSPNLLFKIRSRDPNRRVAAKTRSQRVDISPAHKRENKNYSSMDNPSFEQNERKSRAQQTLQREWARSLQQCLLEAEAELQRSRKASEEREREFVAANIEIARLRELLSSQTQRMEELARNIAQMKPLTLGKNSNSHSRSRSSNSISGGGAESNNITSLEGLSISDIKKVVHSATEALHRVEAQYETEKRRRRALEKENDELHHQINLARQAEGKKHHGEFHYCCNNETHIYAMNFIQGPLQEFLMESAEVQERVKMFGTRCNNVHS